MKTLIARDQEEEPGLAEYALIVVLIAVVAIVSLLFLGDVLNDLMAGIGEAVDEDARSTG